MDNTKIIGIDLFAGAGGMSLGAEMAGISVEYAVEIDRYAAETYKANHLHTKVINSDIRNVASFECSSRKASVVLFGGAPCQGFSTSNRRTNTRSNPDNWLYKEFVRLLKQIKPDWVVFENVTGLLDMESGSFFQSILDDFGNAGYCCSYSVLTASDYGVPQNRSRLFIIGSRNGEKVSFAPIDVVTKVSVKDAFSDLPILENGANIDILPYAKEADNDYAQLMRSDLQKCSGHLVSHNATYVLERYKHVKQGENWAAIPKNLMQNYADPSRCHTGIYYRLKEDQPSVVIGNYRKGCKEARNVIGYPGLLKPSLKYHLVILTGFEQERATRLVELLEPDLLSLGNGVEPTDHNHSDTMDKIREEFSNWAMNLQGLQTDSFEFSCSDIQSTIETITKVIESNPNHNFILVPLNTKLSTISVALVALQRKKVQVCYPIPEVYNTTYSKPSDNVTIVELNKIQQFVQ